MIQRVREKNFKGRYAGKLCFFLCGLLFLLPRFSSSQALTFGEAVKEMLDKNFDIRIVGNNKEIASSLNDAANAGLLPTLDATVGYEKSISNTEQQFLDGRTDNREDAERNDLAASLMLNWTLFDGFSMFAQKEILESNEKLSGYYLRAASEEAVMMLASLYYRIVQQQKSLEVSRETMTASRERYRLAGRRASIGSGSSQEVIQALLDLNADSSMLLTQQTAVANLKTELGMLLAREAMTAVEVVNVIPVDSTVSLSESLGGTEGDIDLLIARENTRIAHQQTREARSSFFPEAGIYAGYNYGNTTSEVGFLRSSRSQGPVMGFFINFNLFNGLRDYKNVQAKMIEEENSQIAAEKAGLSNKGQVLSAYNNYRLGLDLLKLENQNIGKAGENLAIALKKYELGSINSVEFREIQLQLVRTQNRLLEAQYSARIYELELKKLSGTLRLNNF